MSGIDEQKTELGVCPHCGRLPIYYVLGRREGGIPMLRVAARETEGYSIAPYVVSLYGHIRYTNDYLKENLDYAFCNYCSGFVHKKEYSEKLSVIVDIVLKAIEGGHTR